MGKFVKAERIPISDDEGNTIWIRGKMDVGTVGKVKAAAFTMIVKAGKDPDEDTPLSVGAYETALLQYNIVAWEGPGFLDERGKLIPCNPLKIAELDPDDLLLKEALEEIGRRNVQKASPDPKLVVANGSMSVGVSDSPED